MATVSDLSGIERRMTKKASMSGPKGALLGGTAGAGIGLLMAALLGGDRDRMLVSTLRTGIRGSLYGTIGGILANPKNIKKALDRYKANLDEINRVESGEPFRGILDDRLKAKDEKRKSKLLGTKPKVEKSILRLQNQLSRYE